MMQNVELETLRKEKQQLIPIHSKYMNRKEMSVSTETDDQVCTIQCKFLMRENIDKLPLKNLMNKILTKLWLAPH